MGKQTNPPCETDVNLDPPRKAGDWGKGWSEKPRKKGRGYIAGRKQIKKKKAERKYQRHEPH